MGPERLEEEEVAPDGGDYGHLQNKEPTEKRGVGRGREDQKLRAGFCRSHGEGGEALGHEGGEERKGKGEIPRRIACGLHRTSEMRENYLNWGFSSGTQHS